MNTLDPRLKHIIKEQLLVGLPEGIIETITRNIERAWREMPEATGNDGTYLEETRLDELEGNMLDVNENSAGEGAHSGWYSSNTCCPTGPPGVQGVQGVK